MENERQKFNRKNLLFSKKFLKMLRTPGERRMINYINYKWNFCYKFLSNTNWLF